MLTLEQIQAEATANYDRRSRIASSGCEFGRALESESADKAYQAICAEMARLSLADPDEQDIFTDQALSAWDRC